MSNHIPKSNLKEKKLNINNKTSNIDDLDLTEFTKNQNKQREKAVAVYSDIMDVFKKHNTSIQDAYIILAGMLESIYTVSILDELGIKDLK